MKREGMILIGGGGHCRSVIEACESVNLPVAGILDIAEKVGERVCGYEILGEDSSLEDFAEDHQFVVTVGSIKSAATRKRLFEKLTSVGGKAATVIASTAHVSRYAEIGRGTVVLHGAFVNAGAVVGDNCILNTGCIVDHDVTVGNHSHISTGALLNGCVDIGEGCFIGSGAVVIQGVHIAAGSVIGAGAVVTADITGPGIYAGVPAKKIGDI